MERFWKKVRKAGPDECWIWTGAVGRDHGYGRFGFGGKVIGAHQVSYLLAHPELGGHIPEGKCVLHSCDIRRCVNPQHLSLGTILENARDAQTKGRLTGGGVRGSHGNATLTWPIVRFIRKNYRGGHGELKYLYTKYGVSKWTILAVLKGRTWREKRNTGGSETCKEM